MIVPFWSLEEKMGERAEKSTFFVRHHFSSSEESSTIEYSESALNMLKYKIRNAADIIIPFDIKPTEWCFCFYVQ